VAKTTQRKEKKMRIYVGNLSYETSDESLRDAFEAYGQVESATVITDKYSGRSRGFGFVEMPEKSEAMAAIEGLNGTELDNRSLTVNEARPRQDRGGRGRGGRDRGGRGRGGRGRGGRREGSRDRDY
jgi:cold-inducible RNA-binding protein